MALIKNITETQFERNETALVFKVVVAIYFFNVLCVFEESENYFLEYNY